MHELSSLLTSNFFCFKTVMLISIQCAELIFDTQLLKILCTLGVVIIVMLLFFFTSDPKDGWNCSGSEAWITTQRYH
jgi:hypothetical protein